MYALAIALPSSSHFIYIPVVFLIGIVIGFVVGSKATRDAIALRAEEGGRARGAQGRTAPPRQPQSGAKPTK